MKSKKVVVAVGVAFGIAASFLAMIPSSHRSEAAIAVIDQKNIADGLLSKIQSAANHGDGAQIVVVEQKKKQEGQRLPYSLSTLQVEAGRKYGLTPQQVLDTMQSLYEMKLTTYPRSDCEYLPTNQMGDASVILKTWGTSKKIIWPSFLSVLIRRLYLVHGMMRRSLRITL